MTLSGRTAAFLAAGVVPIVAIDVAGGPPFLVLTGWILLTVLLVLVDLILAGSPRCVTVTREVPGRVRLGESVDTVLFLSNEGSRAVRAVIRDAWQPSAGAPIDRSRSFIPAGERRAVRMSLTPTRRGDRLTRSVTVRSAGPLGFAARQATLFAPGRLRVLPPFTSRRLLTSRLAKLRELDGRTALMIRGQGTEFDSLREYVRGDDMRSIDWRATARRRDPGPDAGATLMVRTWRPERDRRVVIVVDSGRTSAARVGDEPRLDTAFEAALLTAALATRARDRVDVIAYDRLVRARVQGSSGADLLSGMVDALAVVEPALIETDWAAIPSQVHGLSAHRALVVLLTSIESPAVARGLLSVLPQLTDHHLVLVASVLDPAVTAASRERADRTAVYRAAAAERALLDGARTAEAVRRLGADVVTGSPSDLPAAVADRYLALKAAGRL